MSIEEAIQFSKDGLEDELEKLLCNNPALINSANAVSSYIFDQHPIFLCFFKGWLDPALSSLFRRT